MIGGTVPKNPFFLAPMAGVTDSAYRTICAELGAGMTYTEMVSAKALVYGDKKTSQILDITDAERPCAAQIFGGEPEFMAKGAVLALEKSHADFIDINMGCPVAKIVNNGEGSALMRDIKRAEEVISAVKNAVSVPVTVKFRKGYDDSSINAVEFARMAESAGASAICVHGRTRVQMYGGSSDVNIIENCKKAVKIPLFASGDVFSASAACGIMDMTGADGVMIARGSMGNPFIFEQCLAVHAGKEAEAISLDRFLQVMCAHISLACERKGELRAMPEARKHALWYMDKLRGGRHFKVQMAQVRTLSELYAICEQIKIEDLQVK